MARHHAHRSGRAFTTAALATLALLLPAATSGADQDFAETDNRCRLSRIAVNGQELGRDALVDGRLDDVHWFAAPAELEVRFLGAPRWLNRIAVHRASTPFRAEILDPRLGWRDYGSTDAAPEGVIWIDGPDTYAQAIRIVPALDEAESAESVSYAEIEAFFLQIDPDAGAADGSGDGKEYFYEWIEDYPTSPLYDCEDDAEKLCDGLPSDWTCWGYGDWSAWEEDFKRNDLGGTNGTYVDSADLAYFSGHGGSRYDSYYGASYRSMIFADSSHDDDASIPSDARGAWDNDLEWMAFSGCNLLEYPSRAKWHNAMRGMHLLFGWEDVIPDIEYGKKWAKGMNGTSIFDPAKTMKQAWFDMAESKLGAGYTAAVVGETTAMGGDYVWGEGTVHSDPTYDSTYTVWTYTTTSFAGAATAPEGEVQVFKPADGQGIRVVLPSSLAGDAASSSTTLPVFAVLSADVTIETVDALAARLCQMFQGLCDPGSSGATPEGTINVIAGHDELRVSIATGAYEFVRSDRWWIDVEEAPQIPGEAEAAEIALAALQQLELLPPGATPWLTRTAVQAEESSGGSAALAEVIPLHRQVAFRRTLAGRPVFGAGGQLLVSVGAEGIERIHRNAWRRVEQAGEVEVLSLPQAVQLLADQGADAALDGLGAIVEEIIVQDAVLGYHERDDEAEQAAISPVWHLSAIGVEPDGTQIALELDIEADFAGMSVIAAGPFAEESQLCFEAQVSGGVAPFTALWSSSVDGLVGSGLELCYEPSDVQDPEKGEAATHVLTVEVTDARGHVRRGRITFEPCDLPDANGDGMVDVTDLLIILEQWGSTGAPGEGGDVSGDGTVDVQDLLLVLEAWGEHC